MYVVFRFHAVNSSIVFLWIWGGVSMEVRGEFFNTPDSVVQYGFILGVQEGTHWSTGEKKRWQANAFVLRMLFE
jgi:hypothetical protein